MGSNLTEKDFIDFLKLLEDNQPEPPRQYVVYTGYQGMVNFSLAMCNMYMPTCVKYTYSNPKKVPHIYYLSIGYKHSNVKVVLNTRKKDYTVYEGVKEVYWTNNADRLNEYMYKYKNYGK